ncbi:hypothetical protein H4582DRAFT_2073261 [Lactarius indigo]|nr:hypothetical protein H4582DRAFT_2073261 [Lactarius indigo]
MEREVIKGLAHDYNQQQSRCARHWRYTASVNGRQHPLFPLAMLFVAPSLPLLLALWTVVLSPFRVIFIANWLCPVRLLRRSFWEGREHLLLAQAASDPHRPQAVEGGKNKIVTTPQLVHDIFDEYPVVSKVYDETCRANCPKSNFGDDIFSQSFSIRIEPPFVLPQPSMSLKTTQSSTKLQPKKPRNDEAEVFIGLEAICEDHEDTGNEDVTTQAGKRRGELPLVRKFNEHSGCLLKSAMWIYRRRWQAA